MKKVESSKKPGQIVQMTVPTEAENVAATKPFAEIETREPQTPFDAPTTTQPTETSQPKPKKIPARAEFWDKVAAIPLGEWGTRIFLYLYQSEPISSAKTDGERKYLQRYERAVLDPQEIMIEHGSGKYSFTLTNRKPSKGDGTPIDRFDFTIENPLYPPKLPPALWANDTRNKRWAALLPPKEEAPKQRAATEASEVQSMFGTFLDIQDRVAARVAPPAAPVAAATTDRWEDAQRIMEMRMNNPMMEFMVAQMKELSGRLVQSETQKFEMLMAQIRERQPVTTAAATGPKSLADQVNELTATAEALAKVGGMFGGNGRGGKWGWIDAARELVGEVAPIFAPIAQGIGAIIVAKAQQAPARPAGPGQAEPNPQVAPQLQPAAQHPPDRLQMLMREVVSPALLRALDEDDDAEQFAISLYNMVDPKEFEFFQNFNHPQLPGLRGPAAIVAAYRASPMWLQIKDREEKFQRFVTQFCAWRPEVPVEATVAAVGKQVVDFDGELNKEAKTDD